MKKALSCGLAILSVLHFSQVTAQLQPAKPLDYMVVPPESG